jgi:hypothetical protein
VTKKELCEEILRAARNGDKELADILIRMIKQS